MPATENAKPMRNHRLNTAVHTMLLCIAALFAVPTAGAQTTAPVHALALHGEPKYPAGFTHFDYVNPDAPVGGTIRFGARGTFDSFHQYIPKGNAAGTGSVETLLVSSLDEPFTEYGLIAESLELAEDRSWVTFTLREEARWHDGVPITPEDVIWSLETLKSKGPPFFRFYYGTIETATKVGPRKVKFDFNEANNRELPLIAGQIPILPKHYWEERDFEATTLDPPLGSGPYRVKRFEAGRFVELERVEDYWGWHLPVNKGQYNFAIRRTDYFRDDAAIRLSLMAGDLDYREENQAKAWAVDYDVPVIREGLLIKENVKHKRTAGMQALVMNIRRELFADINVRKALAYAFDFEWTNRNLFFGQYTRNESYFDNSELASRDLPDGEELEILEEYRDRLPESVFTTPYIPPATDGTGWPRDNLREAFALLKKGGWSVKDLKLVNDATGAEFVFEILLVSPAFERIVLPFKRNLSRLGIDVRVRLVDQSQYVNRLRQFDFDMIVGGWGQSDSPGNEQRGYWGTQAADAPGSRNYIGIKDPVVDALIEKLIVAPSRESLVARTRALDRVLLNYHYVVPNWHSNSQRLLYWDKFSRPDVTPKSGTSITLWWFDDAKAEALAARLADSPDS